MKETLSDLEKSHTVSLAKAVEKYNQAMESNVQLENEKSDLMYQVHKLEGTVQQLEEKLSDSAMMCEAIKQEYEQERQAYSILKSQYNQMKETLQHNDVHLWLKLRRNTSRRWSPVHSWMTKSLS
ncbi:leucine-rich repeat flightless-interacting protein 2-like [Tachysurus vachellii]|uniref:leucine-rich repeat flightless-interacting protein 2-like n=1 Tax=Tachysurus vachellii TaxID=175792 RepID=UPI00296B3206|nr:leucine-rich repeat flightless-interacting protein 2-like [Tachysurus vachellii]